MLIKAGTGGLGPVCPWRCCSVAKGPEEIGGTDPIPLLRIDAIRSQPLSCQMAPGSQFR